MKKLLLHSCCAPCSTAVIERLMDEMPDYEILVYYYNPNIYPKAEYEKRKSEQIRYIGLLNSQRVQFIDADYECDLFEEKVKDLHNAKEGGARCSVCFALRLDKTAKKAKELSCDMFGTTLTVSPHKNATLINQIGTELERKHDIKFLVSDFKKKDGYKRSITLSKENNIYRQNYCGCKYSIWFDAEE